MTTYTADDFKNASFARRAGGCIAMRHGPYWVDSDDADFDHLLTHHGMAESGWVPVQESRPLTLDDLSDEELAAMTRRAHAEAQLWCASKDLSPALINTLLAAALTPPPARPEGAYELETVIGCWAGRWTNGTADVVALADLLASKGVRVMGSES